MTGAPVKFGSGTAPPRLLWWAIVVLGVLALAAFLMVGAGRPADPTLGGVPGFGEVGFRVSPAGAEMPASAQFCALLAQTEAQRAKGLMGRRDLAGYDAMVFRFEQDTSGSFYMRNVPVPLSIAWFDSSGAFVSSTDMAPCPDQEGCPHYLAARPYRFAVEVLQGGLPRLGIGEGSRIDVGGGCRR